MAGINLDPPTVAEAKLSIKQLRLAKKSLQARKREASALLANERAQWRETTAGRYSTVGMGRGTGARFIRAGIQGKRRSERMQHADRVNQMNEIKQSFDDAIMEVDRLIIQLEARVLRGS